MPKLDLSQIAEEPEGEMPPQYTEGAQGRVVRVLSKAGNLSDFVLTHVVVPPGGWSSQRHWHEGEDEFAVILSGQAVLVDEVGRHPMVPGDVAVFPKGDSNAHHLINESALPVVILAVSLKELSPVHYPDRGKRWTPGQGIIDE